MTLTLAILNAIDERLRRSPVTNRSTDVGEVVSVSTDRLRAMIKLDRATVATPCKVAGDCWCRPGDKVLISRTGPGGEWYATNVLSRVVGPNVASYGGVLASGTATGTAANLPTDPSFTWTKRFDTTPVSMFMSFSFFISAIASTVASLGFTNSAGVQTIYQIWHQEAVGVNDRLDYAHWRPIPDATITTPMAADDYVINLMWHRGSGAGGISVNADDWASALVVEGGL